MRKTGVMPFQIQWRDSYGNAHGDGDEVTTEGMYTSQILLSFPCQLSIRPLKIRQKNESNHASSNKDKMHASLATLALLLNSVLAAPPSYGHRKPACSDKVIALATGIHLNIQGQYSEYNGTLAVQKIESLQLLPTPEFYIAKGQLLSDIQEGMNLREFNQQIAPAGNAVIPGLAKYQTAQAAEQKLAEGLTGIPSEDATALSTLLGDIKQGIQLNTLNLKNVSGNVSITDGSKGVISIADVRSSQATQDCDFTLKFPPANESATP